MKKNIFSFRGKTDLLGERRVIFFGESEPDHFYELQEQQVQGTNNPETALDFDGGSKNTEKNDLGSDQKYWNSMFDQMTAPYRTSKENRAAMQRALERGDLTTDRLMAGIEQGNENLTKTQEQEADAKNQYGEMSTRLAEEQETQGVSETPEIEEFAQAPPLDKDGVVETRSDNPPPDGPLAAQASVPPPIEKQIAESGGGGKPPIDSQLKNNDVGSGQSNIAKDTTSGGFFLDKDGDQKRDQGEHILEIDHTGVLAATANQINKEVVSNEDLPKAIENKNSERVIDDAVHGTESTLYVDSKPVEDSPDTMSS